MTRQEKIELLKSLQTGRNSLSILKDRELSCTFGYSSPKFFVNGGEVNEGRYLDEMDKQIRSGKTYNLKFTYGPEEPV